jgi:hypothetical protein
LWAAGPPSIKSPHSVLQLQVWLLPKASLACGPRPTAQPVAEVIPSSVCSLLFCSFLFLPHGLAKAERQKITGMQYNPTNQRETPCLSFSTLCLYLVFPFSEELGSSHLLLPQDQSVGRALWETNLHSIRPRRPSQAGTMFLSSSPGSNLFKRLGVYKTQWTRTQLLIARLNRI